MPWQQHAERQPANEAIVHYEGGVATRRWTWRDIFDRAQLYSARLQSSGVKRGDVCALIIPHNPEFYPLYMGVVIAGAIPAVLAYPNPRIHPDKFRSGLVGMSRSSGLDWILTDPGLHSIIDPLVTSDGSTIRGAIFPISDEPTTNASVVPVVSNPSEPCLLQHSSGTTGLQKAVMLSHRAVLDHVRSYSSSIGLADGDRVVSWLPLYHDMGLIAAFHLPLSMGVTSVQLDPFEWVSAPVLFLQACSTERATIGWLPNFAYNHMAMRVNDEDMTDVRLDTLRLLVNCSEPVRAESHDMFASAFARYGFNRSALAACYAMAETTFAVAQTVVGQEARRLDMSGRVCVSSGPPIAGCEVRVMDAAGNQVSEEIVGELEIKSLSMFDGYRNNPDATRQVLRDGWYSSGDYGFISGGEVFVIGRKKDIIIVAGKNVYPEDVEDAVSRVEGVLPGRVVAFGLEDPVIGTERIAIVAETSARADDYARIKRAIIEAAMRVDISITSVYLVKPRWLIKSSAGKPSRQANKERVIRDSANEGASS
jgi:acyl-CoA synthetase (AMP-forming)/AMP-acid ligase II